VFDQYDLIAAEYAHAFTDEFDARPFDRRLVQSFTELVLRSGGNTALDVGCGPGQAAAELTRRGLTTEGIDGSAAMISIARQRYPQIPFHVADMRELPYRDGTFSAVSAWYSIIHTPADELADLFTEFRRVLTNPGWLLLGFQTDAPPLTFDHAFGRKVSMTFLRHDTTAVHNALTTAGFAVFATATRERAPQLDETAAQAFVIAFVETDQVG
jgi:ubiquinone/menaquinone biosynthesis C-methylase UbiE